MRLLNNSNCGNGRGARAILAAISLSVGLLLVAGGCGPGILIHYPKFPGGVVGQRLKMTLNRKKRVGVIAKELPYGIVNTLRREGLATEWSQTMLAKMRSALDDYGYYDLVDVESRSVRYDELAKSQMGMTSAQLAIGREAQVDHFFYVNMMAIPRVECRVEMVIDKIAAAFAAIETAQAIRERRMPNVDVQSLKKPTGVLYLTVFLEGKLVNIETGASTSYANTEPYRLANGAGNQSCPSQLAAFGEALEEAAKKIADRLSPRMESKRLALETSVEDIKGGDKAKIKQYLEDGFKWMDADDMEEAEKSFQAALYQSGGMSASALWNLAMIKFANGQMIEADGFFQRAMAIGGQSWLTDRRRKAYALFRAEKKRLEEEHSG